LHTLEEQSIAYQTISAIPNAYILKNADDNEKLWKLDIIKRGHIYLQGTSSQLPVHFFDLKESSRVLDLAAAPGGKTTQLARILKNTGEIIALDTNAIRLDKLKFTL